MTSLRMVANHGSAVARRDLVMRCPTCLHRGTLSVVTEQDANLATGEQPNPRILLFGYRTCPNPECQQIIFVVIEGRDIVVSFPPERIDFDASNLPPAVLATLEEAVTSHSNRCYVAAGMIVRKTLEELCEGRGATGPNLKERIAALVRSVMMPKELLDGLDDLRLLGNDAAHVEAKTYNQIGKDEVEISLEFTKEVLKAVYQYNALLERLRSLKKP